MERRQYPRVDSINLVSMGEFGAESPIGVARTLQMSEGGALLEMARPYPIHTVFQLDLALGSEIVPVRAEVRNIRVSDEGKYQIGIRFAQLQPQHRELLERHLEAKLAEQDGSRDT